MKSDHQGKEPSKRHTNSRVKMYLRRRLSWLWGYPLKDDSDDALHWHALYFSTPWEEQRLTVDNMTLSATTYSRNKLFADFPKALPRIVGDAKNWSAHIDLKLEAVRELLEGNTVDPWQALIAPQVSSQKLDYISKLQHRFPEFTSILDKFAWWLSADINVLFRALNWLEQQAVILKTIQQQNPACDDLFLKLFFLNEQVGDKYCQSLLCALQHDGWKVARSTGFSAKQVINEYTVKPDESHDLIKPLITWLDTVLTLPKRALKYRMEIFTYIFPVITVERLGSYWLEIDTLPSLLSERQKQLQKPWADMLETEEAFILRLQQIVEPIEALKSASFHRNDLSKILQWYGEHPDVFKGLQNFISALKVENLPQGSAWRHPDLTLLVAYSHYKIFDCHNPLNIKRWIKFSAQLVKFVKAERSQEKQRKRLPMLVLFLSEAPSFIIDLVNYGGESVLGKLGMLCDRLQEPMSESAAYNLAEDYQHFTQGMAYWKNDLPYLKILVDNNIQFPFFYDDGWDYLKTICQNNSENLMSSIKRWGKPSDCERGKGLDDWDFDFNLQVVAHLYEQGFGEIAAYFGDKKEHDLLNKCQKKYDIFKELKAELPMLKSYDPAILWLSNYPNALHDALSLLNKYHDNAQHIAEKQLSQYFPSKNKLQQQIEVLQQKIAESSQAEQPLILRLASLQQRLNTATEQNLSSALIKKLISKLYHAAYSRVLNCWHDDLTEHLEQRFSDAFELGELPADSIGNPRHKNSLMALLSLSKSTQAVAKKVLQARLQTKPWDLRDSPENQQFLQKIEQKGIDVLPWLNGIGELQYEVQDNNDKPLLLSIRLEDDPLEVLHMGNHFQTCLSSNDFNYFSVVANMADINKRVIYLRTPQEKIIGRCLFALNDEGALLNFWAYSHLGEDTVRDAVNFFADELARAMKTLRSGKGRITKLLAHKWYDDGAVTNKESDSDFEFSNSFKQQLLKGPLNQVTQLIAEQLEGKHPRLMIVQHLLRLPLFEKRPELSLAMHDLIIDEAVRDREIRFQMTKYLLASGKRNLAFAWVKQFRFRAYDLVFYRNKDEYPTEEIELLIATSPTLAYRVLIKSLEDYNRANYESRNRADEDNRRLCYLGEIHELLYRPRKAIECYQAAINTKKMSKKSTKNIQKKIALLS